MIFEGCQNGGGVAARDLPRLKTCMPPAVTYASVKAWLLHHWPLLAVIMPTQTEPSTIPDERLTIEQRADGAIVVRVRSAGDDRDRLPDAVFSFRCGDPQYAYWLARYARR